MQPVPGLDALKLIPMIVQAANRACMHKKNCKQLAQRLQVIGNLLKENTDSKNKRCEAAQQTLELLEEAVRKAYRLVKRCQKRNFFHVLVTGWNIENQFRESQNEIDRLLNIVTIINLREIARVKELLDQTRHDKEKAERAPAKERAPAMVRARAERAERAPAMVRARAERAPIKVRARAAAARAERAPIKVRARAAAARAERTAAEERERERELPQRRRRELPQRREPQRRDLRKPLPRRELLPRRNNN